MSTMEWTWDVAEMVCKGSREALCDMAFSRCTPLSGFNVQLCKSSLFGNTRKGRVLSGSTVSKAFEDNLTHLVLS